MTYAPRSITALAAYWQSQGGVNLGIVGDTRHQQKGRSYHLGRSQLTIDAYSRATPRDKLGLTEAASALDIGRLGGSLGQLRAFSRWFVERCRDNAPITSDVREVIYTPDGKVVMRWDRERGIRSLPRAGEADASHLTHTHISFYRDSERRAKVGLFTPYFSRKAPSPTQPKEAPVAENPIIAAIQKRTDYLRNEVEAGDTEGAAVQAAKIAEFALRFVVLPEVSAEAAEAGKAELDPKWFEGDEDDTTIVIQGGSPGSPNGLTFTAGQTVQWWKYVLSHRLDTSLVDPEYHPGSSGLTDAGKSAARALKGSGNLAPRDFNPLNLEIIP